MASGAIPYDYYTSTGLFFVRLNDSVEFFDRMFIAGRNTAFVADKASQFAGNHIPNFSQITTALDKTRGAICATRFIFSLEAIFSRRIFYRTNPITGEFLRNEKGEKIVRHWADIASDIALTCGRLCSAIGWLNRVKAINLGQHSQWIGGLCMAAFTIVTTICTLRAVEDFYKDPSLLNFLELICNPLDAAAMFWENGFALDLNVVFSIIGGTLLTLSALAYLLKEIIKFNQTLAPAKNPYFMPQALNLESSNKQTLMTVG